MHSTSLALLFRHADHRWSASYVTYYSMWFRLFATAIVPFAALVFFNVKILVFFRRNKFNAVNNTSIRASSGQQHELTRTASLASAGGSIEVQQTQTTNGHNTMARLNRYNFFPMNEVWNLNRFGSL